MRLRTLTPPIIQRPFQIWMTKLILEVQKPNKNITFFENSVKKERTWGLIA